MVGGRRSWSTSYFPGLASLRASTPDALVMAGRREGGVGKAAGSPVHTLMLAAICPMLRELLAPLANMEGQVVVVLAGATQDEVRDAMEAIYSGLLQPASIALLNSHGLLRTSGPKEEPKELPEPEEKVFKGEDLQWQDEVMDNLNDFHVDFKDSEAEDEEEESDWEDEKKRKKVKVTKVQDSLQCNGLSEEKKGPGKRGSYKKKDKSNQFGAPKGGGGRVKGEFSCEICEREKTSSLHAKFKSHNCFVKHMLLKHQQPAACPHCPETYLGMKEYKQHIARNHSPHVCDVCGDSFTQGQALSKHKETVHDGVKRTCPYCGVKISALISHIKWVHEGKWEYCSACDYKTRRPGQLQRHFRAVHTSDTLTACDVCGGMFKRIDRHLANTSCGGTPRKRYKCDQCEKDFGTKERLGEHIKNIHEQIRDKHCPHCSYTTYKQYNLKLHVSKMHMGGVGMVKMQCPFCDTETTNLPHHMKTYHPTQPPPEHIDSV